MDLGEIARVVGVLVLGATAFFAAGFTLYTGWAVGQEAFNFVFGSG